MITRDFWSMAGTDPTQIYKRYLGNEKAEINIIKLNNSDFLLRKLIALYNITYEIYIRDRHTREVLVENNF